MYYSWTDLAFGNKKEIKNLNPTFIVAPRELSTKRFIEIFKTYVKQGNVLFGISSEDYVLGFEDLPQYKMLKFKDIEKIANKIENSPLKDKLHFLEYSQKDLKHILEKLDFQQVILVNGSWSRTFHNREEFYTLVKNKIPFEFVSPFVDEEEAREYEKTIKQKVKSKNFKISKSFIVRTKDENSSDSFFMKLAQLEGGKSFDNSYHAGVVLVKNNKVILTSHNKIVPFETHALHYGLRMEQNMSVPNDANFYDTNHAEVELLIKAQKEKVDLKNTILYINLLPCPSCARMLSQTDIKEIVYQVDHSEGYAVTLLEKAGKKVRRFVI